jgi:hypothetical protein
MPPAPIQFFISCDNIPAKWLFSLSLEQPIFGDMCFVGILYMQSKN